MRAERKGGSFGRQAESELWQAVRDLWESRREGHEAGRKSWEAARFGRFIQQ
jgi:hypothetical protein